MDTGAWTPALVGAYVDWAFLCEQLTPDGRPWGITCQGHTSTHDVEFIHYDGETWTRSPWPLAYRGLANVLATDSITAIRYSVADGTYVRVHNGTAWADAVKVWGRDEAKPHYGGQQMSVQWQDGEETRTGFVLYGDSGGVDTPGNSESYTGGILWTVDGSTWTYMPVVDPTLTVTDPELGEVSLKSLWPTEMAVAFDGNGGGVALVRMEREGFNGGGALNPFVTEGTPPDDASGTPAGLIMLTTADGGATWTYRGRARDTAGNLCPPYQGLPGAIAYVNGRYLMVTGERRYSYLDGDTTFNDPRQHDQAVWGYTITAADLAGGGAWTTELEKQRPDEDMTNYTPGAPTIAVLDANSLLIGFNEHAAGADESDFYTFAVEVPTVITCVGRPSTGDPEPEPTVIYCVGRPSAGAEPEVTTIYCVGRPSTGAEPEPPMRAWVRMHGTGRASATLQGGTGTSAPNIEG